jgi:dephospho-CoA kinase
MVRSSAEIQLQRLMKRDNSTHEAASSRLNSQLPISDKVSYADYILDNSGSLQDLREQFEGLLLKLNNEAGWSWRLSWFCPPFAVLSAASILAWKLVKRQQRNSRKRR